MVSKSLLRPESVSFGDIVKIHYPVAFTLQPRVETSQLFMTIRPQDDLVHSLGDPILPGGIGRWDQTDIRVNTANVEL